MKIVKGFNFDIEKDKDILDHLKNKGNKSKYIKDLIRKDMNKTNIESIVKKVIQQHLKDKTIINSDINNDITNNTHTDTKENNNIDVNSILSCMSIR